MSEEIEIKLDLLCRLCSTVILNGSHLISDNSEGTKLVDQIWECLHIKIKKDDGLPKFICTSCFNTTHQILAFKETCQAAQIKLKQYYQEKKDLISNEDKNDKMKVDISNESIEEPDDNCEGLSTDNDDSECQENGNENLPELGEPSSEDYVLMKEETFSIDANKLNRLLLNSANSRGKAGNLGDHLVEFNNNSDLRDRDVVEIQRVRQELLPPMWDVYEKSSPNEAGELQVTHRRYIVSKGAFPCSLCGACFKFDQGCERGEAPDNGPYDCIVCHKVFPKRSAWKKHQTTHEDVKPFLCRDCGKGFSRQEHLSRHLLSHIAVRPYTCDGCGKSYARKEHLNRHLFSNPVCLDPNVDPVRPYTCPSCSQGFVRKEHLIRHCKRAHDIELNDGEPKPFCCQICSKTFTRREHLRRHKVIHTKEEGKTATSVKTEPEDDITPPLSPEDKKPQENVKCEICQKSFSRRSHVLRHMKRIHNKAIGEVYRCAVCNKQFGRKYHLERHQLCHVKPEYECVTCGEKFDQSEMLDKHMTNIHGNAAVDNYLWM